MIFNASFWAAVAFGILVLYLGNPLKLFVLNKLDERRQKISLAIQEAARLREEAQELLEGAKKNYLEAQGQVNQILRHAEEEVQRLHKEALKHIETLKNREENLLRDRVAFIEKQSIQEVKETALKLAVAAVTKVIEKSHTPDTERILFDKALEDLDAVADNFASKL